MIKTTDYGFNSLDTYMDLQFKSEGEKFFQFQDFYCLEPVESEDGKYEMLRILSTDTNEKYSHDRIKKLKDLLGQEVLLCLKIERAMGNIEIKGMALLQQYLVADRGGEAEDVTFTFKFIH